MSTREFTQSWFSRNIPMWEKMLAPLKNKPVKALEIGSFEGQSTVWLLENILTHPQASIICVDAFSSTEELKDVDWDKVKARFHLNIAGFEEKVNLKVGKSREILQYMTPNTFDFIYIDGSHLAKDVLIDCVLSHMLLRKDGIIIMDDYLWGGFQSNLAFPKPAIDAFLECFATEYQLLSLGYQVALKKLM